MLFHLTILEASIAIYLCFSFLPIHSTAFDQSKQSENSLPEQFNIDGVMGEWSVIWASQYVLQSYYKDRTCIRLNYEIKDVSNLYDEFFRIEEEIGIVSGERTDTFIEGYAFQTIPNRPGEFMSYYTEDRPNTLYFKAVGDLSSDNLYKWAITTDLTGNYTVVLSRDKYLSAEDEIAIFSKAYEFHWFEPYILWDGVKDSNLHTAKKIFDDRCLTDSYYYYSSFDDGADQDQDFFFKSLDQDKNLPEDSLRGLKAVELTKSEPEMHESPILTKTTTTIGSNTGSEEIQSIKQVSDTSNSYSKKLRTKLMKNKFSISSIRKFLADRIRFLFHRLL